MSKATNQDDIHKLLWERADSFGRVKTSQKDLAQEFSVARETMNRVFKRMVSAGRIRLIRKMKTGYGVIYQVTNPEEWTPNESE